MKKRFYILYIMYAVVGILSLTTAACSSDKEEGEKPSPENKTMEVAFSISVPGSENASNATRIPDPGTDTGEHDDWDRLTVIIAYTQLDMKKTVYYDTFTKDEFYSTNVVQHKETNSRLLPDSDNDGFHELMMVLPTGSCHIYGVTYTAGKDFDPEGVLNGISDDGKDHNYEILNLQISNDYAEREVSKFVSVATGYAINTKNNDKELHVSLNNIEEMRQYWRMQLNRLAAKVDIQWDAQSAYEKNTETGNVQYTDVKINSFSFCGGAATTGTTGSTIGTGSGYLFPTLAKEKNLPAISGKKDFINTSEISRRNGRVYHYTFPDGHTPKITFKLETTTTASTGNADKKTSTYTFDLKNVTEGSLLPATWYKINVKVTGKEKQESVSIDTFK